MGIPSRHLWAAIPTAFSAGFLLCGYEFVRGPSITLFKAAYGTENLPVAMALMPLGVILLLYLYSRALSLLGPRRTLLVTTLASGAMIALCYAAVRAGSSLAIGALYVFRQAYIVLIIEQYWSFINSTFGRDSARKLNGPIAGVASLGAISGGMLVGALARPLGSATLVLFAAASVIPTAILSDFAYAKCGEPQPSEDEKGGRHGHMGLGEFRRSRPLLFLFLVIVATQVVSVGLDLRFQGILQNAIPDVDKQTSFIGWFFAAVNSGAAFLQFVAAPILLRWLAIRTIHLGLPLIHAAACAALIAHPSLETAAAAFLLFKCFDYSVFRAAKEILYIPLSFDARYRAKEIIDVFGYRFSKGGASLVITLVQQAGVILTSAYSFIALAGVMAWLGLIVPLMRHHEGTSGRP
ncbi:MAG: Npt1/Npt2 family nucleotide transporter [Elusimicrobiota bacterium]